MRIVLVLLVCLMLMGCGETIRGVGSDLKRMGRGVKTIFGGGE